MRETVSVLASFNDIFLLSMAFRCVRDLRSQDQLVDSKIQGSCIRDFTDGLAANGNPLSQRMKKSRPYTMNNIIELTSLAEKWEW